MPGIYDEGIHYRKVGYGLGISSNSGGGTEDVGCGSSN